MALLKGLIVFSVFAWICFALAVIIALLGLVLYQDWMTGKIIEKYIKSKEGV